MARGRDPYRQAQIERKRALQEEKAALSYSSSSFQLSRTVSTRIARINDL